MKFTVADWTNIQNGLHDRGDDAPRELWYEIERRTIGKMWQAEVAIGIPKRYEPLILTIAHEENAKLIRTQRTKCDHREPDSVGGVPIDWKTTFACPLCDAQGYIRKTVREVPPLPV